MDNDIYERLMKESQELIDKFSTYSTDTYPITETKSISKKLEPDSDNFNTMKEVLSYLVKHKDNEQEKPKAKSEYTLNTRVKLAFDTYDNWAKSTRILLPGELALIQHKDEWGEEFVEIRCGDGKHTALESLCVKIDYH